jgi:heavy metal sensor kinase
MPRLTIGWRLTLWYGAVLGLSLCGLAVTVYVTFAGNLLSEIDRALDEELAEIELEIVAARDVAERERQLQKYFAAHAFYEIQVSRPDGATVFASDRIRGQPLPVPPIDAAAVGRNLLNVERPGAPRLRLSSRRATGFDGPLVIQAADSLELYDRELRQLLVVLVAALPLVLAAALTGGYLLSRKALSPVDRVTRAALDISAERLDRRVEVPNPGDELGRLAIAFNAMIDRLRRSFEEMQRFTADAAHELRTPLAVLRTEAEVALRAPRSTDQYRQVLESQVEEIERLTRLADQLLFLCREDAGLAPPVGAPVRVDALLEELTDNLAPVAQAQGLSLEVGALPGCAVVMDEDRLRRLFYNLLDNALKYTPAGGAVRVRGGCENGSVDIVVEDTGVGIAAEHLPGVFGRFYRVDSARSRSDGHGLGLAICRSIVEGQQGTIHIDSVPGRGTAVHVLLPRAPTSTACGTAPD